MKLNYEITVAYEDVTFVFEGFTKRELVDLIDQKSEAPIKQTTAWDRLVRIEGELIDRDGTALDATLFRERMDGLPSMFLSEISRRYYDRAFGREEEAKKEPVR